MTTRAKGIRKKKGMEGAPKGVTKPPPIIALITSCMDAGVEARAIELIESVQNKAPTKPAIDAGIRIAKKALLFSLLALNLDS